MYRSSGLFRSVTLFILAAALGLSAAVLSVRPAAALETNTLGISPVGESDNFHLELLPGESSERRAVVTNYTDEAHRVLVYPVDATVTDQGGFALGERGAAERVGAWVGTSEQQLVLPPDTSIPVSFRLTVPVDAAPGDYAGGIVIETEPKGLPQDVGHNMAVQMNLVERIGVRVYLRVAGEAVRKMSTGALTWKQTEEGIRFSLPVTNDGNVQLKPKGDVRLAGFNLRSQPLGMSDVETLLPGSTVTMTALWRDPPLFGTGRATAHVAFGQGDVVRASAALRLFPLLPAAALLVGMIAGSAGIWRFRRLVRRARQRMSQEPGDVSRTVVALSSAESYGPGGPAGHEDVVPACRQRSKRRGEPPVRRGDRNVGEWAWELDAGSSSTRSTGER